MTHSKGMKLIRSTLVALLLVAAAAGVMLCWVLSLAQAVAFGAGILVVIFGLEVLRIFVLKDQQVTRGYRAALAAVPLVGAGSAALVAPIPQETWVGVILLVLVVLGSALVQKKN